MPSKQHLGRITHEDLEGLGPYAVKFPQALFECMAVFADVAFACDLAYVVGMQQSPLNIDSSRNLGDDAAGEKCTN